ncbi:MAG: cation diffusion facilitator family transporter [Bacilli bacterium]
MVSLSVQTAAVRKGIRIEQISIAWMVVEAGVALWAGLQAHSIVLIAFGADSIIELIAGFVLLWRLGLEMRGASLARVQRAERSASWIVGGALFLLAGYILASAGHALWTHSGADASLPGLGLSVASGLLMPFLASAKKRIGAEIGSQALKADGACSIVCAYMAWTVLAGVLLTAWFGWWWADSVAALALVYFVIKEGLEAIHEALGKEDT